MSNNAKDSRMSALESLKAARAAKAGKPVSRKPDPDDDSPPVSPPKHILAPASSPAPGRNSFTETTSPKGQGSKYFGGGRGDVPKSGQAYTDAILGDDHVPSLQKGKGMHKQDTRSAAEILDLYKPKVASNSDGGGTSNSTFTPFSPSPMSSSSIDRDANGQAVKKRAMLSREGSDFDSSASVGTSDLARLNVNTRPVTPMTPSRTSSTEPSSSPIGIGAGLSRFKPRAPVESPKPRTSSTGDQASMYKKLYPKLTEAQIERTLIQYAHEDKSITVQRLASMALGQPFVPPARKAFGVGGDLSAARSQSQSSSASRIVVPKYLPKSSQHHEAAALAKAEKADMKQKSAIYANRRRDGPGGKNVSPVKTSDAATKRRRNDESGSDADWSDGSDTGVRRGKRSYGVDMEDMNESNALNVFNTCEPAELTGTIVCSEEQAKIIISMRPFESVQDLRTRLQKKRGVSVGLFEQYMEVMQGYIQVDRCLNKCESIGKDILEVMRIWGGTGRGGGSGRSRTSTPEVGSQAALGISSQDTGMHIAAVDGKALREMAEEEMDSKRRKILKAYKPDAPAGLAEGVKLKDYQIVGINWLTLMYDKGLSCILADEMGLGKTFQVIAFLAALRSKGRKRAHLILVPSSTLENWVREFQRFAPEIDVQTYYGSQKEREELRYQLREQYQQGELEVLLTTYDLAFRTEDQRFLRKKLEFETCIYDEGHTLKNYASLRYSKLIEIKPQWRLLLTGTPLQNNLQELVSLLKFIHEDIFEDAEASLRQIFKVHAKGATNLLSAQRVSRARTMMTPFVLRRRKAQVLKDLPDKTESKVPCKMDPAQETLYNSILERSRELVAAQTEEELEQAALAEDDEDAKQKTKAKAKKNQAKVKESGSSNILMDLRKAAIHPLLFRRIYNDKIIRLMARECMKEEEFMTSEYDLVVEDMEYMTDSELYEFSIRYKSVQHRAAICEQAFFESAKTAMLMEKLEQCKKEGRRMLLFSQFTQVLNILQVVLNKLNTRYLRLDGSTKVDERQAMVDEFTEDEDIKVFLLSTRAGGMGINLVAASMVVIFDQDFNREYNSHFQVAAGPDTNIVPPFRVLAHNDKQAMDRAYRIGQTRDVLVYKFITEDTIEEEMYALGETKLQLDNAVGGIGAAVDADGKTDQSAANDTKKSLMKTIRQRVVGTTTQGNGAAAGNDRIEDAPMEDVKMQV